MTENPQIPNHIHDIFQNGLPADFVWWELPPDAGRDTAGHTFPLFRNIFPGLKAGRDGQNCPQRLEKNQVEYEEGAIDVITRYCVNGREAVNVIQIAAGIAQSEGRKKIKTSDVEWVIYSSQKSPRPEKKVPSEPQVGIVNGLAVFGPNMGAFWK